MRKNSNIQDELTELIDKTELKKFKTETKIYDFRDLMLKRINKILIVCSLYDYYIMIEDGHLQEAIYNEFMELNLYNTPNIQRLYTAKKALELIEKYKDSLLSIITDLEFKRNGENEKDIGIKLIKEVKKEIPEIPILLQTSQEDKKDIAKELEVYFINKNSRILLKELQQFILTNLGLGDFIFRMPDGTEVIRAKTIRGFRNKLKFIPDDSYSCHNHFSLWFIARTEFKLANKIKPVSINQLHSPKELREKLIKIIDKHLEESNRGVISTFVRRTRDGTKKFQIIGGGSIVGKARGLTFFDKIMKEYINPNYFPDIQILIPKTFILGTDVFTEFMEINNLYPIAVQNISDNKILREFQKADLPSNILGDLADVLDSIRFPLAVRSSSLLEDAMYQPFAGIYATVMIPNSSVQKGVRFYNLLQAIKYVYASTFLKSAKNYIDATGNRIEEEKMAIIIQEIVGKRFGDYFYPHFSGVSRSYNYYPFGKAKATDGVVSLALGLGKTIVDGGKSLQYSPAYPNVYSQFGTIKDYFTKSQTDFWVLNMGKDIIEKEPSENMHLDKLHLEKAEEHGSIKYLVSTYSNENDMLYEGITRDGPRILTFAPILKSKVLPLNDILKLVTRMSEVSINAPVEIEFAVSLGDELPAPAKFAFLQVKPMVKPDRDVNIDLDNISKEDILIKSSLSLGNGQYDLYYVLFVKPKNFNASMTRQIANEISKINKQMSKENKKYLLIGPGRWGSSDTWLGIPVDFSDITGAQVIVETQIPGMTVDPSQGAHFFRILLHLKLHILQLKLMVKIILLIGIGLINNMQLQKQNILN